MFIQDDRLEINIMLSLHRNPNQIIVSSLEDFKTVQIIPLPFEAGKMQLNPQNFQIYLTCIYDSKLAKRIDFIAVDIGFRKYTIIEGHLNARDQNLATFLKKTISEEDIKDRSEILVSMQSGRKMQCISPLHRINMLIVATKQNHNLEMLDLLFQNGKGYVIDSLGNAPSHYLINSGNMRIMEKLFDLMSNHSALDVQLEFDLNMLEYGFKKAKQWIVQHGEKQVIQDPILFCHHDIKLPVYGTIRCR